MNPWQINRPEAAPDHAGRSRVHGTQGPSAQPVEDTYHRLLKQRIIFLGQEVDDDVANRICAELLLLSAENSERDISLYINSPGGSVSAGMAIYDVMQFIPNDVSTVALGAAASMGQVLLTAGAPGKRLSLSSSRIMMHQPLGGIGGTASDIAIQAEQMLYVKQNLAERIAFHSGQSVERVRHDWDRDRWFTASEAKEYGLIDHVVTRTAEVSPSGPAGGPSAS
ncbi:ATP-dependent Clp protease, protease subunit [Sinosporangium album]|uniref:ATP-dependent Clp protease proteolytic subunit n=1 Tax=Sinosporangium album TaxID=504805 RepID=A0A1G7QQP5_9ACTN|nr:ATP-dependent Clp protease proteolytic subunit [Sinosporangium album]SDF99960.1 ATP-dependent Clp protease, protease subunit [Sinosporangium album]